jgi:hypothetical protein
MCYTCGAAFWLMLYILEGMWQWHLHECNQVTNVFLYCHDHFKYSFFMQQPQ